ncbi:exodeoxyribonuclease V subunit alpha [Cognatilysobacter tabacisoli]|uniref:exodeoxyribonuclease V subunit alpha n=1 Tax=Cognatilysobacter tabacisoli TaxID=2315424 RepID=UPI000E6B0A05|nr:exodeoxyribonuclease V subunit alpha [Lysobacter tabacisoli]
MSVLQALVEAGALRTLDQALARTLRRLDPQTPDSVLAAAALASLAVSAGHAGFDPADPRVLVDAPIDWPDAAEWRAALEASRWVARPIAGDDASAADAPLVLERGLLYLRRYREYERRLALGLRRIGAQAPKESVSGAQAPKEDVPGAADALPALAPLFARLFPDAGSGDRQARAAAVALRHALVLVSGGPGTGKTTTVTRLLVLLVAQARLAGRPAPRIALAAPTGRAAERMAESVRSASQALLDAGIDAADVAALPASGTTLHRLLGTIPDAPRFRHDAENPLPFDVVVVDEASMIDLPLMAKLVEAVADGARLLLLGDPDQLPSVEAGDVLSGVLRAAGDGGAIVVDDAVALQPLLGPPGADALPRAPAFAGRHVHLTRGYRQSAALQLAPLAAAVRDGDADAALALLRGGALGGVQFHDGLADPLQARRDALIAHWSALADADDPARALALAGRLRVLTAVRDGPQGARGLNARIEALLSARAQSAAAGVASRRAAAGERYFHGRLLLVTENSYRHRLFNGDIGVCLQDDDGAVAAWFPGTDAAAPRAFHPAALPAHDSAFAMTVHKAQGSEFDRVWLQLPRQDARVLSRELVYTAITRARAELHVCASEPVLRAALARHAGRVSGLAWRLRTPID